MKTGPDIARLAALIGDPARANMLTALMSGKALTSSELAMEAGVSASTASSHLSQLLDAGLLRLRAEGRHRYWQLAGEEVAQVLESLMGLAANIGHLRVRTGPREPRLRQARICYDHLAGDYGVQLFNSLTEKGIITQQDDVIGLGPAASRFIEDMDLAITAGRPVCRACLDWSARRNHLAGQLGAALLRRFFDLGWAKRDGESRAVLFTADGERRFLEMTRMADVASGMKARA